MVTAKRVPVGTFQGSSPSSAPTPVPSSTIEGVSHQKNNVKAATTSRPTDTATAPLDESPKTNDDHHPDNKSAAATATALASSISKWNYIFSNASRAKAAAAPDDLLARQSSTIMLPASLMMLAKTTKGTAPKPQKDLAKDNGSKRKVTFAATGADVAPKNKKARGSEYCKYYSSCGNKVEPGSIICSKHEALFKRTDAGGVQGRKILCAHREGCSNEAQRNGLCYDHIAPLCSHEGCTNISLREGPQRGGFCFRHHYGMHMITQRGLTSMPGGEKDVSDTSSLCVAPPAPSVAAAARTRHTSSSIYKKQENGGRKTLCSHPKGCTNEAQRNGLCVEHSHDKMAKTSTRLCGREGCENISMRGGLCRKHGGEKIEMLLRGYDSINCTPNRGAVAQKKKKDVPEKSQVDTPRSKTSHENGNNNLLRVLCSAATTFSDGGKKEGNVHEMNCGNQHEPTPAQIFANQVNPKEKAHVETEPPKYATVAATAPATHYASNGDEDEDSDDELGALIYKSSHTAKVRGDQPENASSPSHDDNDRINKLLIASNATSFKSPPLSPDSISMGSNHGNDGLSAPSIAERARAWLSTQTTLQDNSQAACGLVPNQVSLSSSASPNNHHNVNSIQSNGDGVQGLMCVPPPFIPDSKNGYVEPSMLTANNFIEPTIIQDSSSTRIEKSSMESPSAGLPLLAHGSGLTENNTFIPQRTTDILKASPSIANKDVINKIQSYKLGPSSKKNSVLTTNKKTKISLPKKFRPYNRYNVFFIFERERIITAETKKPASAFAPDSTLALETEDTKSDEEEVLETPPLPPRFAHLTPPDRWWIPRHLTGRRKHRKTHGLDSASFGRLAKDIANTWKTIDDETKKWCNEVEKMLKLKQRDLVLKVQAKNKGKTSERKKSEQFLEAEKNISEMTHAHRENEATKWCTAEVQPHWVKLSEQSMKNPDNKAMEESYTNTAYKFHRLEASNRGVSHSSLPQEAHHDSAAVQAKPSRTNVSIQINQTQVIVPNIVGAIPDDVLKGLIRKALIHRAKRAKSSSTKIDSQVEHMEVAAPNSTQRRSTPDSTNFAQNAPRATEPSALPYQEIEQMKAQIESQASLMSENLLRLKKHLYQGRKSKGPADGQHDAQQQYIPPCSQLMVSHNHDPTQFRQTLQTSSAPPPVALAPPSSPDLGTCAPPAETSSPTAVEPAPPNIEFSGRVDQTQRSLSFFAPPLAVAGPPPDNVNILCNTNRSESVNTQKSDKGQEFVDALILMAQNNYFQKGMSLDKAAIPIDYTNQAKVKHCLAAADFVGDPIDIAVLQTEKDINKIQMSASRIVTSVTQALSEWEGNKKKSPKGTGTTVLGLCKRISEYRNRIKKAQRLPPAIKITNVPLISHADLQQLESEQGMSSS